MPIDPTEITPNRPANVASHEEKSYAVRLDGRMAVTTDPALAGLSFITGPAGEWLPAPVVDEDIFGKPVDLSDPDLIGGGGGDDAPWDPTFAAAEAEWSTPVAVTDTTPAPAPPRQRASMMLTVEEKIRQIVGEAIGAGSMCWVGGTGDLEFDGERAAKISDNAWSNIKGLLALTAPSTPGWYVGEGTANSLVFLFNEQLDWYAVDASGTMIKCDWGYVEQVGKLLRIAAIGEPRYESVQRDS